MSRSSTSTTLPMSHSEYNDQLYRTSMFSDCTIKCRNRVYHLHRAILSPRCEFFWKCFDGPFEESSAAIIEMHDDEPETLGRMLKWIYTLRWHELEKPNDDHVWTADLKLYTIADKYGLGMLMDQAQCALLSRARSCSDVSRQSDNEYFTRHIDDFVEMMQWLFGDSLPDREDIRQMQNEILLVMRFMIAKHIRTHFQLQDLLGDIPEFALQLVESLAKSSTETSLMRNSLSANTLLYEGSDGASSSSSRVSSPRKLHIPLNEDSEDEVD